MSERIYEVTKEVKGYGELRFVKREGQSYVLTEMEGTEIEGFYIDGGHNITYKEFKKAVGRRVDYLEGEV